MKILLITSFFPPTHTAGTEKRTFGYAKTLIERGHDVQVLCAEDWERGSHYWNGATDEVFEGIPVRRVHLNWKKSPDPNLYLYRNPLIYEKLSEWLLQWNPDIVHITSCLTLSGSVVEAAKAQNLPTVLTLTDFWFLCHKLSLLRYDNTLCDGNVSDRTCVRCLTWNSRLYQRLRKFSDPVATEALYYVSKIPAINQKRGLRGMALNISQRRFYLNAILNLADTVTAPSHHLRSTFYNAGVNRSIEVVQSGHDLSWVEGYEKQPGKRVRFGYIGQMIPTKGIHTLLEAFGQIDINGQAGLHLYGPQNDPVYWQRLQTIENRNAADTFFHGAFLPEQLGEVLAGLDVLIVPSEWHENNPRVIQEAFASKTPVIASDVGGIAEYVQHGVNGLLFRRGDSRDLGAQIQFLAANPSKIRELSANCPRVKTIKDEIDEFESIYRKSQKISKGI